MDVAGPARFDECGRSLIPCWHLQAPAAASWWRRTGLACWAAAAAAATRGPQRTYQSALRAIPLMATQCEADWPPEPLLWGHRIWLALAVSHALHDVHQPAAPMAASVGRIASPHRYLARILQADSMLWVTWADDAAQLDRHLACPQVLPSPTATTAPGKATARTPATRSAPYRGKNGLLGLEPPISAVSSSEPRQRPIASRGRLQNGDAPWSAGSQRGASQQGNILGRRPTLSMAAATPRGGDSGRDGSADGGGADGSRSAPDSSSSPAEGGDAAAAAGGRREMPELKARPQNHVVRNTRFIDQ